MGNEKVESEPCDGHWESVHVAKRDLIERNDLSWSQLKVRLKLAVDEDCRERDVSLKSSPKECRNLRTVQQQFQRE